MLTCKDHGKYIDDKNREAEYPEARLLRFKREHEERVFRVTERHSPRKTHVVLFGASVGTHGGLVNPDHALDAVLEEGRYPATDAYLEPDTYLTALSRLRAPQVATFAEPDRFEKTVRVVLTFMAKDPAFAKTRASRLAPTHRNALPPEAYREDCALVVSEYFRWLVDRVG